MWVMCICSFQVDLKLSEKLENHEYVYIHQASGFLWGRIATWPDSSLFMGILMKMH